MQTTAGSLRDVLGVHRRALADLDAMFRAALDADGSMPTPCASWSLAELLAHELGQVMGFGKAIAAVQRPTVMDFRPRAATSQTWQNAVATLGHAVEEAAPTRKVFLPELHPMSAFPVERAIALRALDSFVHAWDLARALGLDYEPAESLSGWCLIEAHRVPLDGRGNDRAFGPAVSWPAGAAWPTALRLLGRTPAWTGQAHQ